MSSGSPKPIAFYLPQFHPIPENDQWWGKGFTEWVNVARARPLWGTHYQPHIPLDMGFYDLRLPEVQIEQARLARRYGVFGFCYYYYWFNGLRLLHKPLEILLADKRIDIPFCLHYANQNWTRRWNGRDDDVLLKQTHTEEDDRAFIRSLLPFFNDDRYIRIDDKPLLLVYRTGLYPDARRTAEIWRAEVSRHGLGLYLCRAEFGSDVVPPAAIGYDAAVEFPPHRPAGTPPPRVYSRDELPGLATGFEGIVEDYRDVASGLMRRPLPAYKLFRTALTGWDSTPRRQLQGDALVNSSPDEFGRWLTVLARQSMTQHRESERFIFINAWNEWGEGAHLEPCRKWGQGYLQAVKGALENCREEVSGGQPAARLPRTPRVSVIVSADVTRPALGNNLGALADQTMSAEEYEAVFVDSDQGPDWQPTFDAFMSERGAGLNFRYHRIAKGGRAAANNFGLLHTSAEIVIFLADDFVPSRPLVEAHLRFHEAHPEPHIVGIGGGVFSAELRKNAFRRWLEDSGELFGVSFTTGVEHFPGSFFYVANSSVKRELLRRAGVFDEAFPFPAWDDYEMGQRLLAQGMVSVYLPEAKAIHDHRVTLLARRAQMRWAGQAAAIFERRHPGKQPWHKRCAVPPMRHRWRALTAALKFFLTRDRRYRERCVRSILTAAFVKAYERARKRYTLEGI